MYMFPMYVLIQRINGMKWTDDFFNTRLGKLIMGIIKLLLASFLFTIVNRIAEMTSDVRIGDATIPLG
ncbi:MAG: hypothetical protein ABIK73_07950, partial [candidate division WOR-3 bacterium]